MTKQCLNNPIQPGRRIYIPTCTFNTTHCMSLQLIVCLQYNFSVFRQVFMFCQIHNTLLPIVTLILLRLEHYNFG